MSAIKPPFTFRDDYLGDGVYCRFDGYQIWVYTQEGNRIALEPTVMHNLVKYNEALQEAVKEWRAA